MKLFVALLSFSVMAVALADPAPAPAQTAEEYEKWVVDATVDLKKYVALMEYELTELYASEAENVNPLIVAKIDAIVPNLEKRLIETTAKMSKAPNQHLSDLATNLAAELKFEIETLKYTRKQFE